MQEGRGAAVCVIVCVEVGWVGEKIMPVFK